MIMEDGTLEKVQMLWTFSDLNEPLDLNRIFFPKFNHFDKQRALIKFLRLTSFTLPFVL